MPDVDLAWLLASVAVIGFSLAWFLDRITPGTAFSINARILMLAVFLLSMGTWVVSTLGHFDDDARSWMLLFVSFNRGVLAMTSLYVLALSMQRYRRYRRVVRG